MKSKYLIAFSCGVILFFVIFFSFNLKDDQKEEAKESATTTTTTLETTTDITTTEVTTTTEAVTTTTTTTAIILESNLKEPDYVVFDWSNRTVHTKDCGHINKDMCQKIYGYETFFIDEGRPCSHCNPIVTIGHVYIPDESYLQLDCTTSVATYYGNYDYSPVKGASGRELISYFSAASDTIPLGTYVYVKSDNGVIDSCYRIDDTGPGYGLIDLYYSSYDLVQDSFKIDGKIPCKVWIIKDPE